MQKNAYFLYVLILKCFTELTLNISIKSINQNKNKNAILLLKCFTELKTFRLQVLKKHNKTKKHIACRDKCVQEVAPLPAALQRQAAMNRSSEEAEMMIKFNVAYNIAKEEMPFTKFKSQIQLMKKSGLNVNPTYSNDKCK